MNNGCPTSLVNLLWVCRFASRQVIVTSMMLSDMQLRLDPECGIIPVLNNILLGRTIKQIIPTLEDPVEWLTGKHSVRV
eukprot:6151273-Pyramimonas_sp.AAC.1